MIINTDAEFCQQYARDAGNMTGFCSAVFFPQSVSDIRTILSDARNNSIPVTLSGNRTGLTGGCVPQTGYILSTERLSGIQHFNESQKELTVLPGTSLKEIQSFIAPYNLFFPPDPTEELASAGGIVANNASGARSFLYGSVRNFVVAIECVLPSGIILTIRRGEIVARSGAFHSGNSFIDQIPLPEYTLPPVKNAAGVFSSKNIDLVDIFIGSEGLFGILSSITFKVEDQPYSVLSAVVPFPSDHQAFQFISEAQKLSTLSKQTNQAQGILFRSLEFFDKYSLQMLRTRFTLLPSATHAAIWFEIESHSSEHEDGQILLLTELLHRCSVQEQQLIVAGSEQEKHELKRFRHAVSYMVNEYITQHNFRKLGTDMAVPDSAFQSFYCECINAVTEAGLSYVAYGHFGNSHLHLNMLPKSNEQFNIGKILYHKLCNRALSLGGTYSAEHGTGKLKTEYLNLMYGDSAVDQMKKMKSYFDRTHILNRGNMFLLSPTDF